MKIAILGPYFYPQIYGIEKVMYNHARYLAARGHEVHVLTTALRFPDGRFNNLPTMELREGFTIHRVPVLLRAPWRRIFIYQSNGGLIIPRLNCVLSKLKPDIVHAHNIGAAAWATAGAHYARRYSKSFFYSPHYHVSASSEARLKFETFRSMFQRKMNNFPLQIADKILHLTKFEFEAFEKEFPCPSRDHYQVLPNGVEPPCYAEAEKSQRTEFNVLFVGRVDDPRKGFVTLIDAMRALWTRHGEKLHLTVVGTISEETRDNLIREFHDTIRISGSVSEEELERHYGQADLFVMPSQYEGFGMPFIEAMRYGVPVIGTRVGGVPEVVAEGTGILVPPGDVSALADAIQKLFEDPEKRTSMGALGRQWASTFYWPKVIDQLESLYHDAFTSKTQARPN